MAKVGIIGGSGLYKMDGIIDLKEVAVETPFGKPSDSFFTGRLEDTDVVFLPRHGRGHTLSPCGINYRANIFGMKQLGVDAILSVSAVGSLKEKIQPMDFVAVDQFVDRTWGSRCSTFFDNGIVAHVAFAHPVAEELREILIEACGAAGVTCHKKGAYICMEGPQFSTRAESELYRSWGMDVIGMTNLTEAKLSREAEISYATLAAVTDYDCWHEDHETVSVEMIIEYLQQNAKNSQKILKAAIPRVGKLTEFSAAGALEFSIVTDPEMIPEKLKKDYQPLIGKYIK